MLRFAKILLSALLVFALAPARSAEAQSSDTDADLKSAKSAVASGDAFWATVRNSNEPALYEEYLKRFPNHVFVPIARAKLAALRKQVPARKQGEQGTVVGDGDRHSAATSVSRDAPIRSPDESDGAELAEALQSALKQINCYGMAIDGDWGRGSQAAVRRFNALAGTNISPVAPTHDALETVSNWRGGSCDLLR